MSLLLKYPEPQKNLPPPSPLPHKFKRNGHVRIEADIWKLSSQRQLCITKISGTSTSPNIKCKYEIDSPIEKNPSVPERTHLCIIGGGFPHFVFARNKKRWSKWFKSLRINEVEKIREALRGKRWSRKLITANFKIHVQPMLKTLVMQAQTPLFRIFIMEAELKSWRS